MEENAFVLAFVQLVATSLCSSRRHFGKPEEEKMAIHVFLSQQLSKKFLWKTYLAFLRWHKVANSAIPPPLTLEIASCMILKVLGLLCLLLAFVPCVEQELTVSAN